MSPLPASDSPESRFTALLRAGHLEGAANLLHAEYADELRASLGMLALSLGGADEADHIANWAICLAVLRGEGYDPERGRLAPWLMRLGKNLAISQLRKTRPLSGIDHEVRERSRSAVRAVEANEAVKTVLERLPDALRKVLLIDLVHHGQAPAKLACAELGIERNVFYKRRSQARRLFRELWIEMHGEPGESL